MYFLRTKDEAMARVRTFVSRFNAMASQGKDNLVRVVGSLHTDNAGEFLSRQFQEFLNDEFVSHTLSCLCPPTEWGS